MVGKSVVIEVIVESHIGRFSGAMGTCASTPSAPSALPLSHPPAHHVPNSCTGLAVPSKGSEPESFQPIQCGEHFSNLKHTPDAPASDSTNAALDIVVQHCDQEQISSPSFKTHGRCDAGLMLPLEVNYSCHCSNGHSLSVCSSVPCCHVCGGDASVCMSCVEGCTYGICALCFSSLKAAPDVAPADGAGPCLLGVRPAFLKAFKAKWGHVTRGLSTGQVCKQLVQPLTCRSRGSICEDLMRAESCDVGQATLVLSHSWSNLFDDTVDAILEVLEEERSDVLVSCK